MGARVQVAAYKCLMGIEVIIGFEGDNCETSILSIDDASSTSRLLIFDAKSSREYEDCHNNAIEANLQNGALRISREVYATYPNTMLNKLAESLKSGDAYYDDTELNALLKNLNAAKPYGQTNNKRELIRHLQHHGVNKEAFVNPSEPSAPYKPPEPQYTSWGTW